MCCLRCLQQQLTGSCYARHQPLGQLLTVSCHAGRQSIGRLLGRMPPTELGVFTAALSAHGRAARVSACEEAHATLSRVQLPYLLLCWASELVGSL